MPREQSVVSVKQKVFGPIHAKCASDPSARFEISKAMESCFKFEEKCDRFIQQQDEIIRAVIFRTRSTDPSACGEDVAEPLKTAKSGASSNAADTPGSEEWAHDLAPILSCDLASAVSQHELDAIEELEAEIQCIRGIMSEIERSIIRHVPDTPKEMILKMKFIATLVIDGVDVDLGAFARLVDDVAGAWLVDNIAGNLLLDFDELWLTRIGTALNASPLGGTPLFAQAVTSDLPPSGGCFELGVATQRRPG
jgi:hypothetical protein